MTKPITNINEFVEIYFESGSARIRFKDGVTFESLVDEKVDAHKSFIPEVTT